MTPESQIQSKLDELTAAMLAKGLREPGAQATLYSHKTVITFVLTWKSDAGEANAKYTWSWPEAEAFIAKLPSREERQRQEFFSAVAKAIELSRAYDIEADFVNPLEVMMKSLSANALTHEASPSMSELLSDEIPF